MGKRSRARLADGDEAAVGVAESPNEQRASFFRRRRIPFGQRERLGHEAPGSILKGPPVTITCECGNSAEVAYGTSWKCDRCGRRYDTAKIPKDQYDKVKNLTLRYRAIPIALGAVSISLAIFFTLTGNVFSVFILLPSVLLVWFMIIRPVHRRSFQKAIANLPTWDLRADGE